MLYMVQPVCEHVCVLVNDCLSHTDTPQSVFCMCAKYTNDRSRYILDRIFVVVVVFEKIALSMLLFALSPCPGAQCIAAPMHIFHSFVYSEISVLDFFLLGERISNYRVNVVSFTPMDFALLHTYNNK